MKKKNKDTNREFTKEELQTAKKHLKTCPNSLVTKKKKKGKLKQQYHFKLSNWQLF